MGEDLGWRGSLQPQLQSKWSAISATVMVGIVWVIWHLPLWLGPINPIPAAQVP